MGINKKEHGFTLIEIMVALVIFSFVIAGIIEVFGSSYKSYVVQEDVADVQQNLRVAKLFIERDVRMAGADMSNFPLIPIYNRENGSYEIMGEADKIPLSFVNGEDGPDELTVRYANLSEGCSEPENPPAGIVACSDLRSLTVKSGKPVSSNDVDIEESFNDAEYADWENGCYCGDRVYEPTVTNKKKHAIPAIIMTPPGTKPQKAELIFITKTQVTGNGSQILNNPNQDVDMDGDGKSDIDYENKIGNQYPDGIIKFFNMDSPASYRYYVENEILRRDNLNIGTTEDIVDGIEDLQFAFCGDFNNNNNGKANPGEAGDWLTNPTDEQLEDVQYIRVSILARSEKQHRGFTSARPELEDRAEGDDDSYRRRLIQTTIQIRNLAL